MRILGISPFHDSSVAVYSENGLEFYSKEERLTRRKRQPMPVISIDRAIRTVGPIDFVVIAAPTKTEENNYIIDYVKQKVKCKIIDMGEHHHQQHASLAFYNSGFEESLIFVIDRSGSLLTHNNHRYGRESETVFKASYPCNFETLQKNYWLFNTGIDVSPEVNQVIKKINQPNNNYKSCFGIVKVYETATTLIGQHSLENGKTMGLSAYGDKTKCKTLFREGYFPIDYLFSHERKPFSPQVTSATNIELNDYSTLEVTKDNYQVYADYALNVQLETQEAVSRLVGEHINKTGIKRVCITGGYGLNIVANSYLVNKFPDVEFYFEPLADDSGNSIGAAMYYYHKLTQDNTVKKLEHTFINGKEYDLNIKDGEFTNIENIVDLLVDQKSVAVYDGLAESGPRALGHRSILFDARNPDAKDIVNRIKNREWYRPFAAMILKEDLHTYFEPVGNMNECPFMTLSYTVRPEKRNEIVGVVHKDNTTRIQTVTEKDGIIWKLLKRFKEVTGCSLLLNTSFNLAGEPLVETPEEAIHTLKNSTLDYVWFPKIERLIKND